MSGWEPGDLVQSVHGGTHVVAEWRRDRWDVNDWTLYPWTACGRRVLPSWRPAEVDRLECGTCAAKVDQ